MAQVQLDIANAQKKMFEMQGISMNIQKEYERRILQQNGVSTPVEDFPLPTNTATTAPVEECESCT